MKTIQNKSIIVAFILFLLEINIQAQMEQTIAVINADAKGLVIDSQTLSDLIRLELEKTNTYEDMICFLLHQNSDISLKHNI